MNLTKINQKNVLRRKSRRGPLKLVILAISIILFAIWFLLAKQLSNGEKDIASSHGGSSHTKSSSANTAESLKIDENCLSLPYIKPGGSFFFDVNLKDAPSHPEIPPPSFHVASYFGGKVTGHMSADIAHFALLKETLEKKKGGLVFDMGANQGFFTYYLASLGMDVHAFEISESNFKELQHGIMFNPKEVATHLNLYPVGLGQKTKRFSMKGSEYTGFMKEKGGEGLGNGELLGVTFDCFAYHSQLDLDHVAFVKLDVEGFEIAVLKGAHNSLFRKGSKNIGAMLMEVGPGRWFRAGIKLNEGIEEMMKLSSHFDKTYLIVRKDGEGHAKTCSVSLAKMLKDKNPRDLGEAFMHKVSMKEIGPLMEEMTAKKQDCNFWYSN